MRTFSFSALLVLSALTLNLSAADDLIKTVSRGEAIDLDKILVSGKYTVVEFYADW